MTSSPPDFTDNITQYRQLVETWSAITNIPRDKQGGVLLISLKGKPLQYCLAIPSSIITSAQGVSTILETLEKVYQEQSGSTSYKLFSQLAAMEREEGEFIRAYIHRFDNQVDRMKENEFEIPDEVITFQFLKGSRLSESNKQLVSVSCDPLRYGSVKDATLRLYSTGTVEKSLSAPCQIKHEPDTTMFVHSNQDVRVENSVNTNQSQQFQPAHQSQNVYYQQNNPAEVSSYQQNQHQRPQQDPRRSDPKNWMCLNCLFYNNFSHRTICLICAVR